MKLLVLAAVALALGVAGTTASAAAPAKPLPPRNGCLFSVGFVRCPPGKIKGVSLWIARPNAVIKRGTTVVFHARATEPAREYISLLSLTKGSISGPLIMKTFGENFTGHRPTMKLQMTWKAQVGRYTIHLLAADEHGVIPYVYTSWAFVVVG